MDGEDIRVLQPGDLMKGAEIIKAFLKKHENTFDVTSVLTSDEWTHIWTCAFNILSETPAATRGDAFDDSLALIRLLSRDKTHLDHIDPIQIECLLNIAGIGPNPMKALSLIASVEATKSMCNLVFLNKKCVVVCAQKGAVQGIAGQMLKEPTIENNVQFFRMKLLFLLTALDVEMRRQLLHEFKGVTHLLDAIDQTVENAPNDGGNLQVDTIDLICEILKILFNITYQVDGNDTLKIDDSLIQRMLDTLRVLFGKTCRNADKQSEFYRHVVNLMTNIPTEMFSGIVRTAPKQIPPILQTNQMQSVVIFENHDVSDIHKLLTLLKSTLGHTGKLPVSLREILCPIMMVLIKCVRCAPTHRHYIRSVILPPLKNVEKRPEVGDELRNQMCRLLTSVDTQIRDLAAELLFVICKEDVWRLTKYTGYGNAAGMFANRGLLGGNGVRSAVYSSDSEDSDTEEYKQVQHTINPVLGCSEPPRPNPFEGMSDEQKEHEAMKLVDLMDKLNKQGMVQPCRIDADGRPVPVEHILQLQEELPKQPIDNKTNLKP